MPWLLDTTTRINLERAHAAHYQPTASEAARFDAFFGEAQASAKGSRIMKVVDGVAEVSIKGVMTKAPDIMALIFGGGNTTYSEIEAALSAAEEDTNVSKTRLTVDSGGGQFDGLFDVLAAMQSAKKPIEAVVDGLAASAAYAIVSQAGKITAKNIAARVGSVGVAATIGLSSREVTITSTNAPKKRPDVTTSEGQDMVREELDALHDIFVGAIADGRGTTAAKVNENFGMGAVLLADAALKKGMIDAVGAESITTKPVGSGGKPQGIKNMDLNTLKAQHPDVFAAAVQEGVDQERDRASAHLIYGAAAGDYALAAAAVRDGSPMTETLKAQYTTAAINRRDVGAREEDDTSALNNADESLTADSDLVYNLVAEQLGANGGTF